MAEDQGPPEGAAAVADAETPVGASELLDLEQVGERRFRSLRNLDNGLGSIFGGQPFGQGLAAAMRTTPPWPAHSFTGHFLRAGVVGQPVDYEVELSRDGRRYASRRVLATQGGRPMFDMLCGFHDPDDGPEHQIGQGAAAPAPETLQSLADFLADHHRRLPDWLVAIYRKPFPVELRLIEPERVLFERSPTPERAFWFRMPSVTAASGPLAHQCLLAVMSDFWFAGAAGAMHCAPSEAGRVEVVTLNHSLWFHAPARADDWLLYRTDSPWTGQGRGLVRGLIYDRADRLVATAVQEVTMRFRARPST